MAKGEEATVFCVSNLIGVIEMEKLTQEEQESNDTPIRKIDTSSKMTIQTLLWWTDYCQQNDDAKATLFAWLTSVYNDKMLKAFAPCINLRDWSYSLAVLEKTVCYLIMNLIFQIHAEILMEEKEQEDTPQAIATSPNGENGGSLLNQAEDVMEQNENENSTQNANPLVSTLFDYESYYSDSYSASNCYFSQWGK